MDLSPPQFCRTVLNYSELYALQGIEMYVGMVKQSAICPDPKTDKCFYSKQTIRSHPPIKRAILFLNFARYPYFWHFIKCLRPVGSYIIDLTNGQQVLFCVPGFLWSIWEAKITIYYYPVVEAYLEHMPRRFYLQHIDQGFVSY
jgi:hypothetical protein